MSFLDKKNDQHTHGVSSTRHNLQDKMFRMHKDQSEVKLLLKLPRSERLRKINSIENGEYYQTHIPLKSQEKDLIRERRQGSESESPSMSLGYIGFY